MASARCDRRAMLQPCPGYATCIYSNFARASCDKYSGLHWHLRSATVSLISSHPDLPSAFSLYVV